MRSHVQLFAGDDVDSPPPQIAVCFAPAAGRAQEIAGPARSQEYLLKSQFLVGGSGAVGGFCRGLRLDSGPQFFEGSLGDEASLMNDGNVAAQALDDLEHV